MAGFKACVITILFICLSSALISQSNVEKTYHRSSPSALAKSFVRILARADSQALGQLFPTEQDLYATIEVSGMAGADRGERNGEVPGIVIRIDTTNRHAFARSFSPAGTQSYAHARIQNIEVEELSGMETEFANVTVTFRTWERGYELKLKAVFWTPRGWVLGVEGFELRVVNQNK
jgi:hypothetical protein